jgi:amino acid transporter
MLRMDTPTGQILITDPAVGDGQELKRELGLFSSFALSFSIISVTTGLFANYCSGLRAAGPAFVWTWLIVGAGQALVACVMASLSRSIPLSGYAYQWTRTLAGKKLGWWAGWLMLVQFLSGMPGVCLALASTVAGFMGWDLSNRQLVLVTIAMLLSIAALNHLGVKIAALVNDASVVAEVLGTVIVGLALLGFALRRHVHPASFLFTHPHHAGGWAYLAPLAFSSLMAAWTLTGFEGAANLAEETKIPEKKVPAAILGAEIFSVVLGFLILGGFTMAIPSLDVAVTQPAPLLYIMSAYFPRYAVVAVMLMVFVAIYACALANLTAVTRMIWAMARDEQLPGSSWLRLLNRQQTPANAIWAATLIAVLFTCWAQIEEIITGISVLTGYLTYAAVVAAALFGEHASQPKPDGIRKRLVPKWLCVCALLWLLVFLGFLTIPRAGWVSIKATLLALLLGAVVYWATGVGRTTQTGEHVVVDGGKRT